MSFAFNNELVDFRLLPADINEIDPIDDQELILDFMNPMKYAGLMKHGIRLWRTSDFKGFICLICDVKLNDLNEAEDHINKTHNDQLKLLQKTSLKPVVGIEQVDLYYCETTNTVAEFKCNLCNLILAETRIFWHIISYHHKLQFLKAKFPNDPIIQMDDGKLKHEKMDEKLMIFDRNRGSFQRKRFEPGMIQSSKKDSYRINLKFMEAGYQPEGKKLAQITSKTCGFNTQSKLDKNLQFHIRNQEEFDKGKELLQKINQALLQYNKS